MIKRFLFCFLLGVAWVFPFATYPEDLTTVVQGRPALPDLFSGTPVAESSEVIAVIERSLRRNFTKRLASWGLLTPKSQITLELNEEALTDMPEVEEVLWQFSEAYYFLNKEVAGKAIRVNAWHPFLATAKVKFKGESNFHTYSSWVTVN